MKKSNFQFSNPFLTDLNFQINHEFEDSDSKQIDMNIEFNVNINRLEDASQAIVELTLLIGEAENNSPFYIQATNVGHFKWDKNAVHNVDILLEQNAPALLLSYLRPIVSSLTAASPFSTYNLPFVDFTNK